MKQKLARYRYQLAKTFRSRQAFVVVVGVLLVLIATVLRVNSLNNLPVDQNYLSQQTSKIKSVQFNQTAINQIQSLNQSDINTPGTQLPSNRKNPFNE